MSVSINKNSQTLPNNKHPYWKIKSLKSHEQNSQQNPHLFFFTSKVATKGPKSSSLVPNFSCENPKKRVNLMDKGKDLSPKRMIKKKL